MKERSVCSSRQRGGLVTPELTEGAGFAGLLCTCDQPTGHGRGIDRWYQLDKCRQLQGDERLVKAYRVYKRSGG